VNKPDGSLLNLAVNTTPVLTDGKVTGSISFGRDITEHKRAELELRQSEEKYKLLVESTHTGYVIVDPEGTVLDANQEYVRLTGQRDLEDILGRNVVEWTAPADRERNAAEVRKCFERGSVRHLEIDYINPEGKTTPVEVDATVLRTPTSVSLLTLCRDITEHRRVRELLEQADRRKDEFLAVLSHELRNPLMPIRSSLFVLEWAAPGSEQAGRALRVIGRQVTHLARLVDDLLDVTRIVRGKLTLQTERLDFVHLVALAIEDHQVVFSEYGIELETRLSSRPLWLAGDPVRLAQVVGNLLQNAAKFTPRGGRASVAVDREGSMAVLRVSDGGVGMEPAMLGRIFEPFTQVEQALDRGPGGLGLGLALVRGLVALHHGEVTAASEGPGRGAEFTVRLPLFDASAAVAMVQNTEAHAPAEHRRVLVIEDNHDAAESLHDVIVTLGHEAQVAYDGPEGLEIARSFRPDVVLCDIGLPVMTGYEVARAFRSDEALCGTYLIALTGYGLEADRDKARSAGFDHHLTKPPMIETLEAILASPRRSTAGLEPREDGQRSR